MADKTNEIINRRALLASDARRSTLFGIVINTLLASVKAISGYLGNSYALIADAIESFSDVISSIVVWFGLKIAASPPSEKHPYGKGRAETLAAIIVAIALFAASIGIAIQSVKEIRTPHHAPAPFTLIVLVCVVIVKEFLFRYISKVGDRVGSAAVKTDALHHRSDAITSVAAFIGIVIALIGGDGYEGADDWAALFASGIIAFNAWSLLAPALREILDSNPNQSLENSIRGLAEQVSGVLGTHRCFVRKLGFDYFVDLDILVSGSITVKEGHDLAHLVQDHIRQEIPLITRVLIHVEPIEDYGRNPLF